MGVRVHVGASRSAGEVQIVGNVGVISVRKTVMHLILHQHTQRDPPGNLQTVITFNDLRLCNIVQKPLRQTLLGLPLQLFHAPLRLSPGIS